MQPVIREGRTIFSELLAELASGRQRWMAFYAFDLLYLDGFDLRRSPQIKRKCIPTISRHLRPAITAIDQPTPGRRFLSVKVVFAAGFAGAAGFSRS